LSNAVKFTPKGGSIRVAIERSPSSVDIVVSDTGQGIAPEFLPHVFERFRQADSRFSREHGGLGLGLAIVRQIVELHGGTVHAASGGAGAGATFRITLPDAAARPELPPLPETVQPPQDVVPDPITPRRLDGLRVVAVDDDEDALLLVRSILESAGADVVTASSASAALDLLGETSPDVLIADVGMPLVDGFAFIRSVRQLPGALSRVPAAALTAYARAEDRLAALSSGFDMHIAKPVDADALVAALASLTKR
jgi:CheY-like chemotaxis protein